VLDIDNASALFFGGGLVASFGEFRLGWCSLIVSLVQKGKNKYKQR